MGPSRNQQGTILAALIFIGALALVSAGKYTLLAQKSATPGGQFNAVLFTKNLTGALQIDFKIIGSDGQVVTQTSAFATERRTINFTAQIGTTWKAGDYQVTATASDGSFNASASFSVLQKSFSLFVQTDKAIYKPSQTVKIRVLVTSPELKPQNPLINVTIQDSESHNIMQWLNQQPTLGVTEFSLPLSDEPPLGMWTITVATARQVSSKQIEVAQYTLPRFAVSVELPSYITSDQNTVSGNITAIYTYGENVIGSASAVFAVGNRKIRKIFPVAGKTTFSLSSSDLSTLALAISAGMELVVQVNVTESLTEISLNGSGSTTISGYNASITFLSTTSPYFKSGMNYTANIKVAKPDGSSLSTYGMDLSVRAYYTKWTYIPFVPVRPSTNSTAAAPEPSSAIRWGFGSYVSEDVVLANKTVVVNENGVAVFSMSVPSGQESSFNVEASIVYMKKRISAVTSVNKFATAGSNNIRVSLPAQTDSFKIGDRVKLDVSILLPPMEYFFVATSRGAVVAFSPQPLQSSSFEITLSKYFAPSTTVVVFTVGSDEELIADSVTLNVDGFFDNKVTVSFLNDKREFASEALPGSAVELQVCSQPSLVGVLAVDESVLLLKGGNDITENQLISELSSYGAQSSSATDDIRIPWIFGGFNRASSSKQVIQDAGLNIDTDNTVTEYGIQIWRADGMPQVMAMDVAMKPAVAQAVPAAATTEQTTASTTLRTRTYFPETWLWQLFPVGQAGCGNVSAVAPDSITTWLTTAFSISAEYGLTVTKNPFKIKIFQPFFVTAVLPPFVVRSEEFQLNVLISNYLNLEQVVSVTLYRSSDFTASLDGVAYSSRNISVNVKILPGSSVSVKYWIFPQKLGTITLQVAAQSSTGGDQIEQSLVVKPEGVPQSYCLSEFAQISVPGLYNRTFVVDYPSNVVAGSKRVEIRSTGDVMSASIQGLDRLVQVPYGCGEQNMITFTPNIFVRKYLEATGNQDSTIQDKTERNMIKGYQQELTYLRDDGSFSAFGQSDNAGSTWLTAFVIKSFRQAQKYLESCIDQSVLRRARNRLLANRAPNGSFYETGTVIHTEMQGGSSSGIALTAYVVIAFLEESTSYADDLADITSSVALLESSVGTLRNDVYSLAITTYALALAGSNKTRDAVAMLETNAKQDGGSLYWSRGISSDLNVACIYCQQSGPSDIEMTSYALLTFVHTKNIAKASQVVKWLTKMRNSLGGYSSTQDTVLALQSLSEYAAAVRSDNTSLTVTYTVDSSEVVKPMLVNLENLGLLQTRLISNPDALKTVSVVATGHGSAIFSVCAFYNTLALVAEPVVDAKVSVRPATATAPVAVVEACAKRATTNSDVSNGMSMIEVQFSSGFTIKDGAVKGINVRRIDFSTDGVSVYFDSFTYNWTCINVTMQQTFRVKNVKPAYVKAYPYYQPGRNKMVAYNPVTGFVVVATTLPPSSTKATTTVKSSTAKTSRSPTTNARTTATSATPVRTTATSKTPVRTTATSATPLRTTATSKTPVRTTATSATPVRTTATSATPVRTTATSATPVRSTATSKTSPRTTVTQTTFRSTATGRVTTKTATLSKVTTRATTKKT